METYVLWRRQELFPPQRFYVDIFESAQFLEDFDEIMFLTSKPFSIYNAPPIGGQGDPVAGPRTLRLTSAQLEVPRLEARTGQAWLRVAAFGVTASGPFTLSVPSDGVMTTQLSIQDGYVETPELRTPLVDCGKLEVDELSIQRREAGATDDFLIKWPAAGIHPNTPTRGRQAPVPGRRVSAE